MADQAVEASQQIMAAPSSSPRPEFTNATPFKMPDGGDFGGPQTQEDLRNLERAQAAKAESIHPDSPPKSPVGPEMRMEDILKILGDAKPKGDRPVSVDHASAESGKELPIQMEQPQVKVATPQKKTDSSNWKLWKTEEIDAFIKKLGLGAKTALQKLIAFPKKVFKWVFPDTGSNSKPTTPLQQFPQGA